MERYNANQEPVSVTPTVHDGLNILRQIGTYNLFDAPAVVAMAWDLGLDETAEWIEENRKLYSQGILFGFEPTAIDWDNVQVMDFYPLGDTPTGMARDEE